MRILVPFDIDRPKTRLASVLDAAERRAFAVAMCRDVLSAISETPHRAELLVTAPLEASSADAPGGERAPRLDDFPETVDDRPLTEAVNARLTDADRPIAILMADVPLVTPATVSRLTDCSADVVIAPGLGGGTNALVVRDTEFRVSYHDTSYLTHREQAQTSDTSVETVDSFRLALDVDDPEDLGEVLLHGDGLAAAWLRSNGFELEERDGRTRAVRRSE